MHVKPTWVYPTRTTRRVVGQVSLFFLYYLILAKYFWRHCVKEFNIKPLFFKVAVLFFINAGVFRRLIGCKPFLWVLIDNGTYLSQYMDKVHNEDGIVIYCVYFSWKYVVCHLRGLRLEKKCKRQTAVDTRRGTHSHLSYFEMSLFQLAVKYTSRSLVANIVFDTLYALWRPGKRQHYYFRIIVLFSNRLQNAVTLKKTWTWKFYIDPCARKPIF